MAKSVGALLNGHPRVALLDLQTVDNASCRNAHRHRRDMTLAHASAGKHADCRATTARSNAFPKGRSRTLPAGLVLVLVDCGCVPIWRFCPVRLRWILGTMRGRLPWCLYGRPYSGESRTASDHGREEARRRLHWLRVSERGRGGGQ